MHFTIREMTAGWRGHAAAAVALGLFLTFIGPFQSQQSMTPLPRVIFWLSLVGTGYLLALAAFRLLEPRPAPAWRRAIAVALVSSLPQMFIVGWALVQVRPGRVIGLANLPMLYLSVLSVQALIVALISWIAVRPAPAVTAETAHQPHGRIPPALRADLIALEAEDHYVRVHHRSGSTLILHRFSDAIAEVEGADGLRVHRGWWIKRSSVDGTFMRGGKRWLLLDNGVQVPVSRTYVRQVAQQGWPKVQSLELPTVRRPERA